jgi:ATP-dependent DNA helicase RecG
MLELYKSIQYIKGVGPKISMLMNKINIFTIEDLVTHFPRSYEDRNVFP